MFKCSNHLEIIVSWHFALSHMSWGWCSLEPSDEPANRKKNKTLRIKHGVKQLFEECGWDILEFNRLKHHEARWKTHPHLPILYRYLPYSNQNVSVHIWFRIPGVGAQSLVLEDYHSLEPQFWGPSFGWPSQSCYWMLLIAIQIHSFDPSYSKTIGNPPLDGHFSFLHLWVVPNPTSGRRPSIRDRPQRRRRGVVQFLCAGGIRNRKP